jgi:hypothetical protein
MKRREVAFPGTLELIFIQKLITKHDFGQGIGNETSKAGHGKGKGHCHLSLMLGEPNETEFVRQGVKGSYPDA